MQPYRVGRPYCMKAYRMAYRTAVRCVASNCNTSIVSESTEKNKIKDVYSSKLMELSTTKQNNNVLSILFSYSICRIKSMLCDAAEIGQPVEMQLQTCPNKQIPFFSMFFLSFIIDESQS